MAKEACTARLQADVAHLQPYDASYIEAKSDAKSDAKSMGFRGMYVLLSGGSQ